MAVYDDGASVHDDGMPPEILRDEIGDISAVAAAGQCLVAFSYRVVIPQRAIIFHSRSHESSIRMLHDGCIVLIPSKCSPIPCSFFTARAHPQ